LASAQYEGRTAFVDITNDVGLNTLNGLVMVQMPIGMETSGRIPTKLKNIGNRMI
jgi:hypothetical protein